MSVALGSIVAVNQRWLRCGNCQGVAPEAGYRWGRGRQYGEHPECRFCPTCRASIDYYGAARVEVPS